MIKKEYSKVREKEKYTTFRKITNNQISVHMKVYPHKKKKQKFKLKTHKFVIQLQIITK